MGNKLAVIDSDFFQHLAERDPKGEKIRFVFDAMEYQPVFHSFVYRDELFNSCITAQKLVDEAYIQVIDYDKYLTTKLHKLQYDMEFRQLFQILNRGDDYNQSGRYKDCFSFHEHGKMSERFILH